MTGYTIEEIQAEMKKARQAHNDLKKQIDNLTYTMTRSEALCVVLGIDYAGCNHKD